MKNISLIIPTRRVDEDMLQKCIDSFKNEYSELIVVDKMWDNLSKKINYGVEQATKDYVCIVNDDATLVSGHIQNLCDGGVNSPKILEGTIKDFHGHCFVLPRRVYWEVGGMDEGYSGVYYDDSSMWMECLLHGYKPVLHGGMIISHPHPATTIMTINMGDIGSNNRQIFADKYGTRGLEVTKTL